MSTSTPSTPTDTQDARFLAPETHQRPGAYKLRIGTFRDGVDTLVQES